MKGDKFKRDPDKALRLSKLEPDADKDFEGVGFTNIKGISSTMALGDVVLRGPSILRPLLPGMVGYALVSAGPGHSPYWAPVSSSGDKWISAPIHLSLGLVGVMGSFAADEACLIEADIEVGNYLLIQPDMDIVLAAAATEAVVSDELASASLSAVVSSVVA